MSKTVKTFDPQGNTDRIEWTLLRRRSNAAGPHANRNRPRGGRSGARVALRRQAVSA